MATLNGLSETVPQTAPMAPLLPEIPQSEPLVGGNAASGPTAPAAILPMLVERPAWPRVFPGL